MSRFPCPFFFYLSLKCKTFFETSFELNDNDITLLYQSTEAGREGGEGGISGLKEHLLSFSIPGHVINLIFLKIIELNGSCSIISFCSLI